MTQTWDSRSRAGCIRLFALVVVIATAGCASSSGSRAEHADEIGAVSTVTVDSPTTSDPPEVPYAVDEGKVQTTEQLRTAAIDWAVHDLELPAAIGPDLWLAHVSDSTTGLTAVAFAWGDIPPAQTVIGWTSLDGTTWDRHQLPLEPSTAMHKILALDGTIYGLGQQTSADGIHPLVWSMNDGGGWDSIDLSSTGTDLTGVTLWSAAVNANGIVLGAERSLSEHAPAISFDIDEFRFELNDLSGTYQLVEIDSDRIVTSGLSSDLFGWNEDGQAVYDVVSGELLTVVPWEVWEQPNRAVSPLPIPAPADADLQPIAVEWNRLRIVIDEAASSYEVTAIESGEVVSTGSMIDLIRGPSPVFIDDESGEVALSVSWVDWDALMNEAYATANEANTLRRTEQLVLHSADGQDWVEMNLVDHPGTQFDSLFAVGEEFVATTVEHGDTESTRTFHTSTNGIEWEVVERRMYEQIVTVGSTDEAVTGLSYEERSSAVMTSTDGRSWVPALQVVDRADGDGVWLQFAAVGGAGTAAIATIEPAEGTDVVRITVGERSATFGIQESVVVITDDLTGETLLEVTHDDVATGHTDFATYSDGATSFWSPNGELVMTITDAVAFDALAAADEDALEQVVFLNRNDEWFEADLPDLGVGFVAQLAVGDAAVVIGAMNGDGFDGVSSPTDTITVVVGTPT